MNTTDLSAQMDAVVNNPAGLLGVMVDAIETVTNGETRLVSPGHPLTLLMEFAATAASVSVSRNATYDRKRYPVMATTMEDLYDHMVDQDFLDRFSTPGRATLKLLLSVEELLKRAVNTNVGIGQSQLIIPKHTEFRVGGIDFCIQHPIVLQVLSHGALNIYVDTSEVSPIYTPTTNVIDWQMQTLNGERFVVLSVPVIQLHCTSYNQSLTAISGVNEIYDYPDSFHYARVYVKNDGDVTWNEISTTHSNRIYDPLHPTAVLTVYKGRLGVNIPQIYFLNGLIQNSIRVDIYTTKGVVTINLENYSPNSFETRWMDRDSTALSAYSAPFLRLEKYGVIGVGGVVGGSGEMSFSELRNSVILRSYSNPNLPITGDQLDSRITRYGYSLTKVLDNVSDRTYLVTRELPKDLDPLVHSAIGASCKTVSLTWDTLSSLGRSLVHGDRITLVPGQLFITKNGQLKPLDDTSDAMLRDIGITTPQMLCAEVLKKRYLSLPFHYVVDYTTTMPKLRAYQLNAPIVVSKQAVELNASLRAEIGSNVVQIVYNTLGRGYTLRVDLYTTPSLLDIPPVNLSVMLSVVDISGRRHSFPGRLVTAIDPTTNRPLDDRYLYEFELLTSFDLNDKHQLVLGNGGVITLDDTFDLTYHIRETLPPNSLTSGIDGLGVVCTYGDGAIHTDGFGVSHEQITLHLGDYLAHLWANCRAVPDSAEYQYYTQDIPAIYTERVYQKDIAGNVVLSIDNTTGMVSQVVLHEAGDPVLNEYGQPVYKHKLGDLVVDEQGNPVVLSFRERAMLLLDLTLIDGMYELSSDVNSKTSYQNTIDTLCTWILQDLPKLQLLLIERTQILFQPKTTIGDVEVLIDEGRSIVVKGEQRLSVRYYVTRALMSDTAGQESLRKATLDTLVYGLTARTVSVSTLSALLRQRGGLQVTSVEISGFLDDQYETCTVIDDTFRLSIGKRLVALSNLATQVSDSLEVEFVCHE